MYRFHVEDPITFEQSIRVTIETGHANALANDYSSTAYWYQLERMEPLSPLPPAEARLPRSDPPELQPPAGRNQTSRLRPRTTPRSGRGGG